MKNWTRYVLFVMGAALACGRGEAMQMDRLQVTVPFAFQVGATSFPAGDYAVVQENSGVVRIEGAGGTAMVVTSCGRWNALGAPSRLEFQRVGASNVLREIRFSGKPASVVPLMGK